MRTDKMAADYTDCAMNGDADFTNHDERNLWLFVHCSLLFGLVQQLG
jgi:hypothetical protein